MVGNPVSLDKKTSLCLGEIPTLGQMLSFANVTVGPHPNPAPTLNSGSFGALVLPLGYLRHFNTRTTPLNLNFSDNATCLESFIFPLLDHCTYHNVELLYHHRGPFKELMDKYLPLPLPQSIIIHHSIYSLIETTIS